jgi:hypothetical protein
MKMNFLETVDQIVETAAGEIKVPNFERAYQKTIWMSGRNHGIKRARAHLRHNISEPMPHLKTAPKGIQRDFGVEYANTWLMGYESAVKHMEMKMNAFLFKITHGQIMVAVLNSH